MATPPTHTLTPPRPRSTMASPASKAQGRHGFVAHRIAVNVTMVLGAGFVAWSGAIHLHLWMGGYKTIHVIGPLFLAQAISGFAIALAVVILRWTTAALAGAAFLASTIGGLLISSWHGIFGFHDSLTAPFASASLLVEAIGVALLAAAAVLRYQLRRRVVNGATQLPGRITPEP